VGRYVAGDGAAGATGYRKTAQLLPLDNVLQGQ
jgi:hypothetical protein